jgi:fermentation-respiration switch protein FrsA (DUF1100 family)
MIRIDEPLLIVVGADDKVTPPALSQALYAQSPLRREGAPPDCAGSWHNDVMDQGVAQEAYRTFLAELSSRGNSRTVVPSAGPAMLFDRHRPLHSTRGRSIN